MRLETISEGYGLVEGPVWDGERGLLFSDVLFGGVFAVTDGGAVETVFPHRRGIGGIALHEQNGLVVSGRNISYKRFGSEDSIVLLDRDEANGNVGYNDITTDSKGRIYAGSLGSSPVFEDGLEPRSGNLYVIDIDGSTRIVAEDIQLTNGLAFSPDGSTLYHADSRRQAVMCYAALGSGDLGPKQVFAEFDEGAPDGLVVAVDGSVWVANASQGRVDVFDQSGSSTRTVEIPVPMCTSVCFGGNDLQTLYIVSGSQGVEGEKRGGIYACIVGISGVPVPMARTKFP